MLMTNVPQQAADILKRRSKTREFDISQESYMKLKNAEARLTEFKSAMMTLGREATAAMLSVEDQQQKITFQRLLAMVLLAFFSIRSCAFLVCSWMLVAILLSCI